MNDCVTAILLAGGMGRRMGGIDKGLLVLDGSTLAERAVMRISPQVEEVLVSANRNPEYYSKFGRVFGDEGCGPLSGLRQGMLHAGCGLVLGLPCDTPFFPDNLVEELKKNLVESGAQIAIPESNGNTHQAIMLCKRNLLEDLSGFLEGGGRKVLDWQKRHDCAIVSFPEEIAFFNINTPEALSLAEAISSGGMKR